MKRFTTPLKNTAETPQPGTGSHSSSAHEQAASPTVISRRRSKQFNIAIIMRAFAPAMQETINSITRELEKIAPGQFTCTLFDGRGDERRLLSYTTQIIQNYTMPYDAIVTIGAQASQVATRVSLLLNVRIPIVFAGVRDPAHLGIIYPGRRTESNVTGIAVGSGLHYQDTLRVLQTLKKGVRRVLLPYNPKGAWLAQQASEFSRLLGAQNVELLPLPVSSTQDVHQKIMPFMHDVDTIMTMRDDVVVNSIDNIIDSCNNYGVTLYSADLESVAQGAAFGFAVKDADSGTAIAKYILHIFKDEAAPHEIPVSMLKSRWFVGINEQGASKQGISLSKDEIDAVENAIVFRDAQDDAAK